MRETVAFLLECRDVLLSSDSTIPDDIATALDIVERRLATYIMETTS